MKIKLQIFGIFCIILYTRSDYYDVIDGIINKTESANVSSSNNSVIIFKYQPFANRNKALRVNIESELFYRETILIVIKENQKFITMMELFQHTNQSLVQASKIICPSIPTLDSNKSLTLYVEISSDSLISTTVNVLVNIFEDFVVKVNDTRSVTISHTMPVYFLFQFNKNDKIIEVQIESNDEICMIFYVQNGFCPIYDNYENNKFKPFNIHQTIAKRSTMVIRKQFSKNGIFFLFVLNDQGKKCSNYRMYSTDSFLEKKTFQFVVRNISENYMRPIFLTIGLYLLFVVLIIAFLYLKRFLVFPKNPKKEGILHHFYSVNHVSESSIETNSNPQDYSVKKYVYFSNLNITSPSVLDGKYFLYFWYIIIISIFYTLPVLQLVLTYEKTIQSSGNQDICFYNFRCTRPFYIFTAFNNILSNIGYVILGLLFTILTWQRHWRYKSEQSDLLSSVDTNRLPNYFGLYYAMGISLTMEGVMSACYHICPNHKNFQFDSSYMYIIACIIIIQIYQFRHPEITASAQSFFMIMAIIIFIEVIGVLYNRIIFWWFFTISYMLLIIVIFFEIYYFGEFKIRRKLLKKVSRKIFENKWKVLIPNYKYRMTKCLIGAIINITMSLFGIIRRPHNFSIYLLSILMVNMFVFFGYYLIMKIISKEKLNKTTLVYSFLAIICWTGGIYCFLQRPTDWQKTPAESRELNLNCIFLNFYDIHDIWHFLSAFALFFSFMVLQNIDNCLQKNSNNQILIF